MAGWLDVSKLVATYFIKFWFYCKLHTIVEKPYRNNKVNEC